MPGAPIAVGGVEVRMKWFLLLLVLMSTTMLAGCDVIGDIFQAGFAVGAVAVILLVAGIGFLVMKFKG